MHEFGGEKELLQVGLLCCHSLVTYVGGEINESGEPTTKVCGCYLVHFSCSPTSINSTRI